MGIPHAIKVEHGHEISHCSSHLTHNPQPQPLTCQHQPLLTVTPALNQCVTMPHNETPFREEIPQSFLLTAQSLWGMVLLTQRLHKLSTDRVNVSVKTMVLINHLALFSLERKDLLTERYMNVNMCITPLAYNV